MTIVSTLDKKVTKKHIFFYIFWHFVFYNKGIKNKLCNEYAKTSENLFLHAFSNQSGMVILFFERDNYVCALVICWLSSFLTPPDYLPYVYLKYVHQYALRVRKLESVIHLGIKRWRNLFLYCSKHLQRKHF